MEEKHVEEMRKKLKEFKQDHLLKHWDRLDDKQRKRLLDDLQAIDFNKVMGYFRECMDELEGSGGSEEKIEPPPKDIIGSSMDNDKELLADYQKIGLDAISKGEVAVLLMAGGQGTRLGVTYPKGLYDVGLPSHRTLYKIQAERIRKVQSMAAANTSKSEKDVIIPWYIMTSEHTQDQTYEYFKSENFFSLREQDVLFFEQNTLPCVGFDGKIILETPSHISRAPDGNGGLYKALEDNQILADMSRRGIKYVHIYGVDNILIRLADPTFIGFAIKKDCHCVAKVVEKTDPDEPVGVICQIREPGGSGESSNYCYKVVEYSELSKVLAEEKASDGKGLKFKEGGIANHFVTTEFLETIVREKEHLLKHHVARKKIPHCDDEGHLIKPTSPNGIKMEKFVFDIYPFAGSSFAIWEVDRSEEFAPLKNSDAGASVDNPTTSRLALLRLHARWARNFGARFVTEANEEPDQERELCEISPLLSYAGENLKERLDGKILKTLTLIEEDN